VPPYHAYSTVAFQAGHKLSNFAVLWTLAYLVIAWRAKRRVEGDMWLRIALVGVGLYTAAVSVIAGYGDWGGLMTPAAVPLDALCLLMVMDLVRRTASRLREQPA
jgi:hypothetical protein